MQVVSFPELFSGYEEELSSHNLCSYLYELAGCYSRFWKDCPILTAPEEVKRSRLALSRGRGRPPGVGVVVAGYRGGGEDVNTGHPYKLQDTHVIYMDVPVISIQWNNGPPAFSPSCRA